MKTNESQILEFLYQETEIHFLLNPKEKNVMVNATEMAKLFKKEVRSFLRLDGTQNFIQAFIDIENEDLVRTHLHGQTTQKDVYYTTNKATFMRKEVAIYFAIWLDARFGVWITKTIDKLLFSKNQKVAKAFSEENNLISERQKIIDNAKLTNNTAVLDLLEVEKKLKKTDYQKRKAIDEFKSQYKMQF